MVTDADAQHPTGADLDALIERKVSEVQRAERERLANAQIKAPEPPADSYNGRALARQRRNRQARMQVFEAWNTECEAQLAHNQPEIDRLDLKRSELGERREEIVRRHAAELAKLDNELRRASDSITDLMAPPPGPFYPPDEPDPDPPFANMETEVVITHGRRMVVPKVRRGGLISRKPRITRL
jgi:hypothetical protein